MDQFYSGDMTKLPSSYTENTQRSNVNLVISVLRIYLVHLHNEVGNDLGKLEPNPVKVLEGRS